MENLEHILESILFLNGNSVEIKEIKEKFELDKNELRAAIDSLKAKYTGASGIHLIEFDGKLQFCTNPEYSDVVSDLLNPIRARELSQSMLETVAIVAYKQPCTRLEIEEIRGVNSDYAISMLLKNNVIDVVGKKDVIGRPLLYGTTDEFLKRFQIESVDNLPDYNELLSKIKSISEAKNTDLYDRSEKVAVEMEVKDGDFVPKFVDDLKINPQKIDDEPIAE